MKTQTSTQSLPSRLKFWFYRPALVRRFGQAQLVRLPNGQHQLLGGTSADRAAAIEWVSLFAHEIVFTHLHRESKPTVGTDRRAVRSTVVRASTRVDSSLRLGVFA